MILERFFYWCHN